MAAWNEAGPRTVFVCVRDRHGKGASCAGSGARALLNDMRAALLAEEIGPEELSVKPCGCLGLCKQGPVMVAAAGADARAKKPRKKQKNVWTKVAPEEIREVLREAMLGPF